MICRLQAKPGFLNKWNVSVNGHCQDNNKSGPYWRFGQHKSVRSLRLFLLLGARWQRPVAFLKTKRFNWTQATHRKHKKSIHYYLFIGIYGINAIKNLNHILQKYHVTQNKIQLYIFLVDEGPEEIDRSQLGTQWGYYLST